jgi:hypothetical protein
MKTQTMRQIYAPTVFAVGALITAVAVMAGNWLLAVGVICALLAGARLSHQHPFRRHKKLR